MKALITGASSGIGRDIAIELSKRGYDLILVARNKDKLNETAKYCSTNVDVYPLDVSTVENCKKIHDKFKDIDLLVNNAGFGLFGEFVETDLNRELEMIDLNIKSVHTLTKLYLKDMIKKDSGRILNVASSAAFLSGPLMSTYYSTKSYVYRLTTAIYEELRRIKSNVKVSVLCPGPVATNFNNVADVSFAVKALTSRYVAKYTVDKMLKNKLIIIPGSSVRLGIFATRLLPLKVLLKINYNIQRKKDDNDEK